MKYRVYPYNFEYKIQSSRFGIIWSDLTHEIVNPGKGSVHVPLTFSTLEKAQEYITSINK